MKKILVIGSLNADMVVRVPHIPVASETILAETADMIPGGEKEQTKHTQLVR